MKKAEHKRSASQAVPSADFWRRSWQWLAIGVLATTALVLGYIGFSRSAAAGQVPRTPMDLFYLTLQLFVLESGSAPGKVSWELEIARLVAPLAPAWTVIMAAAVLFREQIQRFRLSRLHDHVVVCGLGRLGLQLSRAARSASRHVVVVETDEGNNYLQSAVEAGCSVIVGDSTDTAILARARADRARYVLAVSGEDGVNVATTVALHNLILRKSEPDAPGVTCYAHLMDPDLCTLLRGHRSAAGAGQHLELQFFNLYQDSARLLLEEHPLDWESIGPDESREVHLVIVGLGRMGESLALEAARVGHYANGRRLRVTIVDREAAARLRAFYGRHRQYDRVANVTFTEGDAEERDTLDQLRGWAEDENSLATVAVCLDGDAQAFSVALAISSELAATRTPIWVRLSDETGLASLIAEPTEAEALKTRIRAFGQMSCVCTLDMLFRRDQDALARTIHEEFVRARALEGRPANEPSMQPWVTLEETLKNSNRQQADHITVKLRAVGCRSVPTGSTFHPAVWTDAEVEIMARMEHARWNAERLLAGWTSGPRDATRKVSPYLVPWEELPENIRDYDREAVRQIPHLLSLVGCRVERTGIHR